MQHPQLPRAELDIMQTIWEQETPISSVRMTELMRPIKGWKKQTVYTLLSRLVDKGFLSSEKQGKERCYAPLIDREEYLQQETGRFVEAFHKNSLTGFMRALVSATDIDDTELAELADWLESRKKEEIGDV